MPAVQKAAYLHMKGTNLVQITVVSTRRLPFSSFSPARSVSLTSIFRKFYFFLFTLTLPWWLRLHPQEIELKNKSMLMSLPVLLSHTICASRTLAWCHHQTLRIHSALCVHAPSPCSTSEASARSLLLLFSAGTYVLL